MMIVYNDRILIYMIQSIMRWIDELTDYTTANYGAVDGVGDWDGGYDDHIMTMIMAGAQR